MRILNGGRRGEFRASGDSADGNGRASARVVHVCREVLGEIVGAGEALAARLAVVRSLSGVDAQVTS